MSAIIAIIVFVWSIAREYTEIKKSIASMKDYVTREEISNLDIKIVKKLSEVINDIKNDIEVIKSFQSKIEEYPNETKFTLELSKLTSDVDSIKTDIKKIQEIILRDPEDDLSLVLLNKEVESIQDSLNIKVISLREQIESYSRFNLLIIGALITAIVGLFISQLFGRKKETKLEQKEITSLED